MGISILKTQPHSCGSSDGRFVYEDDKGKRYWKCYACGTGGQGMGAASDYDDSEPVPTVEDMDDDIPWDTAEKVEPMERPPEPPKDKGRPIALPERDLDADTLRFFGVTATDSRVYYPYYDEEGRISGYKVRQRAEKKFWAEGALQPLFGWNKFPRGGKYLTLTEGENDALASFALTGSKWATASIPNGAQGAVKACQEAYEYIDSFENVVICFDSDVPGQQAARAVAELFPTKSKIVRLTKFKDANEYLSNGCAKEYVDSWWRAEKYTPDGIVSGATMWERVNAKPREADCKYPFDKLNDLTYGIRKGELVMVAAGSGLGKSQFIREIIWQILQKTDQKIGAMFLEEGIVKTGISLMSLSANKPLHLPNVESTEDERREAFDATLGTGRLFFFDHFGSSGIDNIVARVRYMAKGLDCGFVFLDHVSIVVSGQENGDERKALDEIMTKLRTVVEETGIGLVAVSHLRRPEGRGHEEGAATSLSQLRGSHSIAQLSDIVIGLERNGQAEDELERNTTFIRVLKNRFAGLTGPAGSAVYSRETGRMLEFGEEL